MKEVLFAWSRRALLAVMLCVLLDSFSPAQTSPVHTDPLNQDQAVREAYQHAFDLDYEGALARFRKIEAAHPDDPLATDYVLNCVVFRELYRLDLLDTTFYANDGFLTGKHTVAEDPIVRDQINDLTDQVIRLVDAKLKQNPEDLNALFARGWARSLKAAYIAMVERAFASGLRLAIQARNDHEHVLARDPDYVDAKMVVGVYQYVIGSLPFAFKLLIGFSGNGGNKAKGMDLLRDSAARGVITSMESRTCISLFLRREGKYQQAISIVRSQMKKYPRGFLFALEEANLLKDDGQGREAIAAYRRLIADTKLAGHYINPHLELAYFGLGDTLRGQNLFPDAVIAYHHATEQPTVSPELKRRCLLAAGEVYDLMHQPEKAHQEYIAVVEAGPESTQAELARKYMRNAYQR